MYNPKQFRVDDAKRLRNFLSRNNLASVISVSNGTLSISHVPLLLDSSGHKLLGHVARANSDWKIWEQRPEVTCVFQGPSGYISPSWYKSADQVPTWNYGVVHVKGNVRVVHEPEKIDAILDKLVTFHESQFDTPWTYTLDESIRQSMLQAIVGFEIEITSMEGKFKLSQNRSFEDWKGALEGVEKNYNSTNPSLVELMKEEFELHKNQ